MLISKPMRESLLNPPEFELSPLASYLAYHKKRGGGGGGRTLYHKTISRPVYHVINIWLEITHQGWVMKNVDRIYFQFVLLPEVSLWFSLWKTGERWCGLTCAKWSVSKIWVSLLFSVHTIQLQRWFLEEPVSCPLGKENVTLVKEEKVEKTPCV